jgi:hypothetical protein
MQSTLCNCNIVIYNLLATTPRSLIWSLALRFTTKHLSVFLTFPFSVKCHARVIVSNLASLIMLDEGGKSRSGCALCWGTALQARRSWVRFPIGSLEFFIPSILSDHYDLGVDSASNGNEYQGYLLGGNGGRCVGLTTLPLPCADCLEIPEASTCWNPKGLFRPVLG